MGWVVAAVTAPLWAPVLIWLIWMAAAAIADWWHTNGY